MNDNFKKIMNYSPENQKVFDELAGLCIKRLIVPYIGAGMSVFAGFKTWNIYIDTEYANCFQMKKPDEMDNIVAADLIEQQQGKDFFYENVRTSFGGDLNDTEWQDILKRAENQPISVIQKLFSGPIVTTNFDQIIEKIHNNELPVVFPHNSEELEKAVNYRKRLVYKVHGCISDAHKVVFTKSVYDKVYDTNSELVKSLSKFFQGFHFLFLGSSLDVSKSPAKTKDYSMDLWEKLKNAGTYHFAILDCAKDQLTARRKELEDRNIHAILFETGKFESVKIILDELLKIVDSNSLNIPKYNTAYIDRKDSIMEKITNRLDEKKYSVLAITGMGGVGKTRILSEYANRQNNESQYSDIIWINAISETDVREEIRNFLVKMGIKIDEKDPNQIFSKFRQWMNDNDNWLFLLDNVEHYEDIRLFFDCDQMLAGKRHILISSRLNADKLPNIPILPIIIFTQEEALNFFQCYTKKETDEYADKIAERLGWLPLALEQAAAYIEVENESYQGYFELLEKEPLILLEKTHPEPGAVSVRATWNISMQRLKNESARQLLNLCTFFAPDNIHSQWFIDAANTLPDTLRNDVLNNKNFSIIKDDLKTYSLIRIDNNERINMHRLLQEVICESLKQEEQDKWRNFGVSVLNELCYDDISTPESDELCNDDFSYLESDEFCYDDSSTPESEELFRVLSTHIVSVTYGIKEKHATIEVSKLFFFLGKGYHKLGVDEQALEYYSKALTIREKELGTEHPDTTIIYNNMADIYHGQGNHLNALKYYWKVLDIREKTLGKDHPDTATTYNNIAWVYFHQCDNIHSLEFFGKASTSTEKIKGADHPDTATSYNNMALVYNHQGDYSRALEYYNKALVIVVKVLGSEHIDTATTYHNMAEVYDNQDNYSLALEYYEKAFAIREKVLGTEHPDTFTNAANYWRISVIYAAMSKYAMALDLYLNALSIIRKILGEEHHTIATTYNLMAAVYCKQGDYIHALEYSKKALIILENVLGTEDPDTISTYDKIAGIYDGQANFDNALEYYLKALVIREKVLGKEHPDVATTYNNIAGVYVDQGDYECALEYYEKALTIDEKVLGTEHPDTATTYNNIAMVYINKGDFKRALEYNRKALTISEKVLGKEHLDTATNYNNIALIYNNQGNYKRALEYNRKALVIREKVLGKDHPDTATTYNNIADVYDRKCNYERAIEYYIKALTIREKVLGKEHPDTAITYNDMAAVYNSQGDYPKALEYYQKALSIHEKVLGKEHPDVATTYNNIAGVYDNLGDYECALEYYEKALTIDEKVLGKDHPDTATTYNNIAAVYVNKDDNKRALDFYLKSLSILIKILGFEHPDTEIVYNNMADTFEESGKPEPFEEWLEENLLKLFGE